MNKIILTTLVCILSFNFASAQVHPSSNSDVKDVKPYYTSVENLFSLDVGMTYDEVRSVLNAQPFNILNNLENGEIYFHTLTPTYGIRRNITSHFNLQLSFGYGISYSNSVITLEAMPSFRVGYVF